MSEEILSQDEVDALLNGGAKEEESRDEAPLESGGVLSSQSIRLLSTPMTHRARQSKKVTSSEPISPLEPVISIFMNWVYLN